MSEIELGGRAYSIGKLDAFRQFHVVRRLGTLLVDLALAFRRAKAGDIREEVLRSIVGDLSKLSDDDANYVLTTCLSVVSRKRAIDGGWDKLTAPNGALMFSEELDMAAMLQLVWQVLSDNLSNFLDALPSGSPGEAGGKPFNLSTFPGKKIG